MWKNISESIQKPWEKSIDSKFLIPQKYVNENVIYFTPNIHLSICYWYLKKWLIKSILTERTFGIPDCQWVQTHSKSQSCFFHPCSCPVKRMTFENYFSVSVVFSFFWNSRYTKPNPYIWKDQMPKLCLLRFWRCSASLLLDNGFFESHGMLTDLRRAKCWKNTRKISIRCYGCGYQSDIASQKKEIILEYYKKSTSQLTWFPSSVWKFSFFICLFGLVLIWKGISIIPWLISQLHGFTWQLQLAGESTTGTQGWGQEGALI